MARLRKDFQRGTIPAGVTTAAATSLVSPDFATLPVVGGGDVLALTIDPEGISGEPEIVWVTAHTSGSPTVTVSRGQEGSTARVHPASVPWNHAPTTVDYSHNELSNLTGDVHTNYMPTNASRDFTLTPKVGSSIMWHAGNHGPGSGLDADLLDGLHGASYSLISHNHSGVYSIDGHTHNYASPSHGHSGVYADYSHSHNYAATSHTHNYAATSHSHGEYATTSHSHSYPTSDESHVLYKSDSDASPFALSTGSVFKYTDGFFIPSGFSSAMAMVWCTVSYYNTSSSINRTFDVSAGLSSVGSGSSGTFASVQGHTSVGVPNTSTWGSGTRTQQATMHGSYPVGSYANSTRYLYAHFSAGHSDITVNHIQWSMIILRLPTATNDT